MTLHNRRTALFLSVLFAALCGGGSYVELANKEKTIRDRKAQRSVVVARKYLRAGQPIDPGQLEEVSVPVAYIQPTAFEKISDLRDAAGHAVYAARLGFLKGEQLTRSRVIEESSRFDLAWTLEPRHLGVTLTLDPDAACGGHIKPGDWVAVMAVFDPQPGVGEARADVIESRVQVAAVNGRLAGFVSTGEEKTAAHNLSNDPFLVTLSLTSRQADRVLLARSRGHIALALRSAVDDESPLSASVRLSDLRQDSEGL